MTSAIGGKPRALQQALESIIDMVAQAPSSSNLLQHCCEVLLRKADAKFVRAWAVLASENMLELAASAGQYIDKHGPLRRVKLGQWLIGKVALSGMAHYDPAVNCAPEDLAEPFACVPIMTLDRCWGILSLGGFCPEAAEERHALERVSSVLALYLSREHQERQSLESKQRLEAALRFNEIGTWFWDNAAEQLRGDQNASRLLGADSAADSDWPSLLNYVHPTDRPEVRQTILKSLSSPTSLRVNFRPCFGLSERWLELKGASFFSSSGMLIAFPCALTDITDRKRHEAQLLQARLDAEAASEARGDFLANVSHEIRTPMTTILGSADLLSCTPPEQHKNLIDAIQRNGNHLLKLIEDILDLSKIDAGKLEIRPDWVTVTTLVREAVSPFEHACRHKGLYFEVDLADVVPPRVSLDPLRVHQVLINLVGNAVKFTQAGGIRVTAGVSENSLQFQVIDSGSGIPAEWLDRIFEPFAQVSTAQKREHAGAGLGLHICRKLIAAMHGDLTVESKEGQGTTFSFSLPLLVPTEEDALRSQETQESIPAAPGQLRGRVLVVDDRADVQMVVKHFVEQSGAEVWIAKSGLEAIQFCSSNSDPAQTFDLILLDLQMPQLNGWQTANQLRQGGYHGPIVALSASTKDIQLRHEFRSLFVGLITKPVAPRLLLQVLNKYLSRRN